MHYSHLWDLTNDPLGRLSPTQTKGIPGFQSKTPVAQMHIASELPLSEGDHSINIDGQMMITQTKPGQPKNGESPVTSKYCFS
jgi:hypothetical protein